MRPQTIKMFNVSFSAFVGINSILFNFHFPYFTNFREVKFCFFLIIFNFSSLKENIFYQGLFNDIRKIILLYCISISFVFLFHLSHWSIINWLSALMLNKRIRMFYLRLNSLHTYFLPIGKPDGTFCRSTLSLQSAAHMLF